ncbi:hypothetical protein L1887_23805 [Cichorium endivia]|nr:hypothetical protein L1887_23805 [Cichorium endivia]
MKVKFSSTGKWCKVFFYKIIYRNWSSAVILCAENCICLCRAFDQTFKEHLDGINSNVLHSKTNVAITLLFIRIWENYVEGEEVTNGQTDHKEEFKVVTEVLGGGKFYVQAVTDQKVAAIQNQLASLNLKEAPVIGSFNPKRVKSSLHGSVRTIHGTEPSVTFAPGTPQLCSLAYLKVPTLDEDYGQEAAMLLSKTTLDGPMEFWAVIEERDMSGGKVKGQGTGNILMVTLIDTEAGDSVNAIIMFKEGVARLEKSRRWEPREKRNFG